MKKLLTTAILLFTLMFSSASYAEWKKVAENKFGVTYVEIDRIRKVDGYIYYWVLTDFFKPREEYGDLSIKMLSQGDCKLFRINVLALEYHKEPMGMGLSSSEYPPNVIQWIYPPPNSDLERVLNFACDKVK